MNYKIIASDLDGTLLNSQGEISPENIDAIAELSQKGVVFAPCTGRTYSEVPEKILNIPSIRYIIHSNGAVVYDRVSGNRITNCIPNDMVKAMMDIFATCENHITFRHNGECYVDARKQDEKSFEYYHVVASHQGVIRDYAVYLDNFEQDIRQRDDVEAFAVFFHNKEDKIRCRKLIEDTGRLKTVEASEYNIEIMSVDAGKGEALCALADSLGVDRKATIGMGDSDNDSSLINGAGLGLAMSNSCEALKKIADEIICSNDEHGVRYVLNHYVE